MKKFFKKINNLAHKHLRKLAVVGSSIALLLMLAVFVSLGIPNTVYAWIIYITATYTPVTTGGYTTISWSAPTSDYCYIFGPTLPCVLNKSGTAYICSQYVAGPNGSVYTGPINGATTYTFSCTNVSGGVGSSQGDGSASLTVTPTAPSCPVSSFGSPWNTTSYLIYSGGQGSISNWYGRYCVHNYSASAIFIPMATPTEWNNFNASAPSLNVGISTY